MERKYGEYLISDNKSLLSLERIGEFLAQSYWANQRPLEKIKLSIENSPCFGIYFQDRQVGFARVVTDFATMYWLCDVFIDEAHRGKGLGKQFVKSIIESDELKGLVGILGTKDAHGLYEQFGFEKEAERFMRRIPKK
jgi:GNAT superfamily N-acetyltransferase